MNVNKITGKLADFFINFAVAAFAVAAFQKNPSAAIPGVSSLCFAIVFAALTKDKK